MRKYFGQTCHLGHSHLPISHFFSSSFCITLHLLLLCFTAVHLFLLVPKFYWCPSFTPVAIRLQVPQLSEFSTLCMYEGKASRVEDWWSDQHHSIHRCWCLGQVNGAFPRTGNVRPASLQISGWYALHKILWGSWIRMSAVGSDLLLLSPWCSGNIPFLGLALRSISVILPN